MKVQLLELMEPLVHQRKSLVLVLVKDTQNFAARLTQANLVNKTDFHNKLWALIETLL